MESSNGIRPSKYRTVEEYVQMGNDEVNQQSELDKAKWNAALMEIDKCQADLDELAQSSAIEILQIGKKYDRLRKPLFDKREVFINKVRLFWVNALEKHPTLSVLLDEVEGDILHFLRKVEVEEIEKSENGFRIKFFLIGIRSSGITNLLKSLIWCQT